MNMYYQLKYNGLRIVSSLKHLWWKYPQFFLVPLIKNTCFYASISLIQS